MLKFGYRVVGAFAVCLAVIIIFRYQNSAGLQVRETVNVQWAPPLQPTNHDRRQPIPLNRRSKNAARLFSIRELSKNCSKSALRKLQIDEFDTFWNHNYRLVDMNYFTNSCKNGCALLSFKGMLQAPNEDNAPTLEDLQRKFSVQLRAGGVYEPPSSECADPQRVVLIIPFRDRDVQLRLFLDFIHSFMPMQRVAYRIVVVEQEAGTSFNRGLLFNAAYRELRKLISGNQEDARLDTVDCLIFHDVDMLPVDDRTLYRCNAAQVTHFAERVDKLMQPMNRQDGSVPLSDAGRYTWEEILESNKTWLSTWPNYFGGVLAMTPRHFEAVNGFSNVYFNWGAEDDDMLRRIDARRITVRRYAEGVNRFRTLKRDHVAAKPNADRFRIFHEVTHAFAPDGLVDIARFIEAQTFTESLLFTHVRVRVDEMALRTRWYLPKALETQAENEPK